MLRLINRLNIKYYCNEILCNGLKPDSIIKTYSFLAGDVHCACNSFIFSYNEFKILSRFVFKSSFNVNECVAVQYVYLTQTYICNICV